MAFYCLGKFVSFCFVEDLYCVLALSCFTQVWIIRSLKQNAQNDPGLDCHSKPMSVFFPILIFVADSSGNPC